MFTIMSTIVNNVYHGIQKIRQELELNDHHFNKAKPKGN